MLQVLMNESNVQVITIDDFITDEECDRLIELGGKQGYDRSTDVGKMKFDGTFEEKTSKTRTSHNAWCTEECYKDDLVQNVLERIAQWTGIPDQNSEYLQLLKCMRLASSIVLIMITSRPIKIDNRDQGS